jgi:hypothetical protein
MIAPEVICTEIHDNKTAVTAIGALRQAVAWFTARGIK